MSREWSDDELLHFCQHGPFDEVPVELIDRLRDRVQDNAALQTAVETSPRREWLHQHLGNASPPRASLRFVAVFWSMIAVACLIVGIWIGQRAIRGPRAESDRDGVAQRDEAVPDAHPMPITGDATDAVKPTKGDLSATSATAQTPDLTTAAVEKSEPKPTDIKPEVVVDELWKDALDVQQPPLAVNDRVWSTPASRGPDSFVPDTFRRWFAAIPGRPFTANEERIDNRSFTIFDGQGRLRPQWVDAAVLRMTVYDVERCSLTFWHGNAGIRLMFFRHRQPQVWAAHRVIRPAANAASVAGELLTTDCGRWQMTQFGPLEFRYENNHLLIARGDVSILKVPMSAAPQDVVIDAKMKFRELSMYRSDPLTPDQSERFVHQIGSNRFASSRPGDLEWTPRPLEGTSFRNTPLAGQPGDAAVELATAASTKEVTWAAVAAPQTGLSELIFKVDHADPGTGVYFGSATGVPQERLGFVWDPIGGRIAATLLHPGENAIEKPFDPNAFAPPHVGESQWFRLIVGVGIVSGWVSPDGVHWGWLGEVPYPGTGARSSTVGVFALPGAERKIRISHFALHELPHLVSLAPQELCQQVDLAKLEPLDVRDVGSWLQQVIKTRPAAIPFAEWRRACAIETLKVGSNLVLAQTLLSGLLADGLFGDFDANRPDIVRVKTLEAGVAPANERRALLAQNLKLLSEAALLYNTYDGTNAVQFSQLWHATVEKFVAMNETRGGDQGAVVVDDALRAMLNATLWTGAVPLVTPVDAVRRELASLVGANRQADVLQAVDRLVFFNTPCHPSQYWWSYADPIYNAVLWAELSSHKGLSPDEQTRRRSIPRRWKATPAPLPHSLAQPLSKEAYNVMAEFQAAISGKAYADACQVIGAAGTGHLLGLLPDSHDDKLLVAFPNAVALAMSELPELKATMNDKFGAIGRLRVRQAMETGDSEVLEAARVQFFGTLAAAESERWLGDRAFAAGQFAEARGYYRRAMAGFAANSQVVTQDLADLQGRYQLASSMFGVTEPDALLANVAFGEVSLSKEQLAALATDLMKTSGAVQVNGLSAAATVTNSNLMTTNVPAMATYKLEAKGKFDGDLGEHVGHAASVEIDWFSRQFAITVDGAVGFMSNRFQLASLDLNTAAVRWVQPLGAEHGHAHHWANVAMKPIVVGHWVFCRRLTKNGPELVAFDKNAGTPLWKFKPKSVVVSDPLFVQGRLQVFIAEPSYAGPVDLRLVTLHPETGNVLHDVSVTRLFDDPQLQGHPCSAVAQEGVIFFALSGVSGCCDAQGQTIWLRRQAWLPTTMDPYRYRRAFDPPLLVGNTIIVTQPGVPVIEALDQRSGRLQWTRSTPDLRRMLGLCEGRLLVETQNGLEAVDPTNGQIAWRYNAADLLDAILLPAPGLPVAPPPTVPAVATASALPVVPPTSPRILLSRVIDGPGNANVPCLVWIDAATGLEAGYLPIETLTDKEPRLGPILATPTVTWIFSGKGRVDGRRDLLALTSVPEKGLVRSVDQALWSGWLPEFQRATFVTNVVARPNIARRTVPASLRDAFVKQLGGWLAIAPPSQPKDAGLRGDVKGQKDALAVLLTPRALNDDQKAALASAPVDALRLIKQVRVPKVDEAVLKFRVGHETGQKWQLIIEGAHCRVLSTIVDDSTSPQGWQDVQVSLSHLANTVTELTVTCAPVTTPDATAKPTWVYLANLDGLNALASP